MKYKGFVNEDIIFADLDETASRPELSAVASGGHRCLPGCVKPLPSVFKQGNCKYKIKIIHGDS